MPRLGLSILCILCTIVLMSFFVIPVLADTYTDPIGDSTNGLNYDIVGGSCTSDGTNLYLSITVDGTIASTKEYAVGLDIDRSSMTGEYDPFEILWNDIGADWAVVYKDGSPELWEWDSGLAKWNVVKSITSSISPDGKTLTLTVALADIGLSAPFIFDLVFGSYLGIVIPVYDKMPDTGHFTFQYGPLGVPEFTLATPLLISLCAVAYLAIRKRISRKLG